jgi:hypothetical protein
VGEGGVHTVKTARGAAYFIRSIPQNDITAFDQRPGAVHKLQEVAGSIQTHRSFIVACNQ